MPQSDHDLLIRLDTKVEMLFREVRDFGITLKAIDETKISRNEVAHLKKDADQTHVDHETRLRRVERWGFTAIGAIGFVEFIIVVMK